MCSIADGQIGQMCSIADGQIGRMGSRVDHHYLFYLVTQIIADVNMCVSLGKFIVNLTTLFRAEEISKKKKSFCLSLKYHSL